MPDVFPASCLEGILSLVYLWFTEPSVVHGEQADRSFVNRLNTVRLNVCVVVVVVVR